MIWNDVSSAYADIFFRVEGNKSGAFGQVQEENSPHLLSIHRSDNQGCAQDITNYATSKGKFTDEICLTPSGGSGAYRALSFNISDGEVRPRNMAIRIWKRTG
jgi:hypothetical protein